MSKEIPLNEIKKIEFDILQFIKDVCEENELRYYLAYGTLLGAVRHKGFIPWDDDIDIHMPRKDYEQFIRIVSGQDFSNYRILSCNTNSDYYYPFAKVVDKRTVLIENEVKSIEGMGAWVDIFPLDGVPQSYKWFIKRLWCIVRFRVLTVKTSLPDDVTPILKPFIYVIWQSAKRLNSNKISRYINKVAMKYDFDTSQHVASSVSSAGVGGVFEKRIFEPSFKVEFEGELFDAPSNVDVYLKQNYGNYMKLPPKEKQITHHSYKIYWK